MELDLGAGLPGPAQRVRVRLLPRVHLSFLRLQLKGEFPAATFGRSNQSADIPPVNR